MPIPTDTFWNIRRLNWVFAASALILLAITGAAIIQDYDKSWREPQRDARAWQAALVEEKIQRNLTPETAAAVKDLDSRIAAEELKVKQGGEVFDKLTADVRKLESDQANMEFSLNTLKANVSVMESQLQDAVTGGDRGAEEALRRKLEPARKKLGEDSEKLAALKENLTETKKRIAEVTGDLDKARKEKNRLTADVEALRKKLAALRPQTPAAHMSERMRAAPLMQFINPAEKIQQVVLPDVLSDMAYIKVPSVDRCMTCHVNISNKDFSEANVLAYLEEQLATARGYRYAEPNPSKPDQATADRPGASAMPEFWHTWGRKLLSPASLKKTDAQVKSIGAATQPAASGQEDVLVTAIEKLYRIEPDDKSLATARNNALAYPERLRSLLEAELSPELFDQLRDRYRHALVSAVNPERKKRGLEPLDPSPVLLAHPRLDLYVDIDSKHSFESVGCTSCHDGSGQETNFVLAAHAARDIWVDARTGEPVLPQQINPGNKPAGHHAPDMSSMLAAVYPHGALVPAKVSSFHMNLSDESHDEHAENGAAESVPADAKPAAYTDPVTGKTSKAIPQAKYWAEKYELESGSSFKDVYHYWDWPMRTPQYIQANCARCHTDTHDIRQEAPVLYEGRELFTSLGCVNCHQMDSIPAHENRRVGTDLRHVSAKLSPDFVNTWIWAPKAFRPSTKMPHFFMLENNSSDEELRRTRQEARAITEFLFESATPLPPQNTIHPTLSGSKEAGKTLFNSLGCLGCHTNLNDVGEKWIVTDLQKRGGMKSDEAKKVYAEMTYNQRQLYVADKLSPPAVMTEPPKYPDGSSMPIFQNHGPELSAVGTKLLAGRSPEQAKAWLFDWLKNPSHYSEYTVMPRLRLSDQQAMDLVEYLLAQKRDDDWQAHVTPEDPLKLRELTAFFLRSRYSEQVAYQKAADDAELTKLATDAMTSTAFPAEQAKLRVAEWDITKKQMVFLGKKLVAHYGCMSCHAINGTENISSPCANLSDWGQKGLDKLDFGYLDGHKTPSQPAKIEMVNGLSVEAANLGHTLPGGEWNEPIAKPVEAAWPHVGHSRNEWITHKLKNTRIYDRGKVLLEPQPQIDGGGKVIVKDGQPQMKELGKPYDKLKMPTFYLRDEQVDAIVTFVISNRDRLISERLVAKTTHPTAKQIARGRYLVEKFNCVGCHQVEHNSPAVQQYYKRDEMATKAPPSLRGEGNKIQHAWLFNFLKEVETLRPLPEIRMPSFALSDEEATAVAAYFAAVSNKESGELKKLIDPVLKYLADEQKAGRSGDEWYTLPAFASAVAALRDWALTNDQIKELQLDPSKNTPEELAKNYRTILFKAHFTQKLYDAPYPFVDSPRPEISDERFKLGEQFFYEMQCLKCHVLGDQTAEGATKNPTAPNLSLTARRLQRRWVRHWVQEPAIIQAGTAMPPFFTGLSVFELHGQPWPKSQGASPAEIKRIESTYGDTVGEQTDLLLDFLYAAGVRNYTGVQPADVGVAEVPADEPAEEEPAPAEQPMAKPDTSEPQAEATPEPAAPAPATNVAVAGKVVLEGESPEPQFINMAGVKECAAHHREPVQEETIVINDNNELKNVIVSVSEGLNEQAFAIPKQPAVLDQQGCMYVPHVLAMMVGQELVIKNSDKFLHNVHSLAGENPSFNFAQSSVDPGKNVGALKAAETFKVKCDVHPWMGAYIGVFEHPFFDVTREDGSFTIRGLAPGQYTLRAWHEKFGTAEQQITVEQGKTAQVKFVFKP